MSRVHHAAPGHERGHDRRPHGRRPLDYGALRLIVLAMIAEEPRHGYELMKAIGERMGGGYSPSPGVVYPTLAWLEDMGYAVPEADAGRKRYRITDEGAAFLKANHATLTDLRARMAGPRVRHEPPAAVLQAMERLKLALRARLATGAFGPEAAERIAAAIAGAAEAVESDTPAAATLRSSATVTTPKAAGYAEQLCKHFAHKVPARFEASDGEISFPAGTCRLHAEGDALTMTVEAADPEAITRLQDVVASHLLRFAFREELAIDWQPAA